MSFRQADRLPYRRCAVMIEDRSEGFNLCALLAQRRADDQVIPHAFPVEMGAFLGGDVIETPLGLLLLDRQAHAGLNTSPLRSLARYADGAGR